MRRPALRLALVAALALASAVRAEPAADAQALARLEKGLANLGSVRAEFTQDLLGKDGASTEHAAGTLYLKKPGRFRWDYSSPKQLIVCDGTTLWLYDPELEQATTRRVRDTLSQTPAMLLSGEARVRDGFQVRDGGKAAGLDWIVLVPKADDTDFREIRLGFAGEILRRLEFADKLNQRTAIELSRLERNAVLADSLFRFVAPPGVDVIGPAAR
ncbi:MAG TPA: outer membrane lipoprotein chaperone LolA [Steroidobacteraceae bacterium]|nr:outer membrane lipoprotein chaperone LolA [Steroidobacteraceae bacterium]